VLLPIAVLLYGVFVDFGFVWCVCGLWFGIHCCVALAC
jgi:hypothetical protein